MLAGCAGSAPPSLATRPVLPAAPAAFGAPVRVREPHAGEDARAYAARERAGRLRANGRLADDAAFYRDVVKSYGAPDAADAPTP